MGEETQGIFTEKNWLWPGDYAVIVDAAEDYKLGTRLGNVVQIVAVQWPFAAVELKEPLKAAFIGNCRISLDLRKVKLEAAEESYRKALFNDAEAE